jgi:hypothetical protein
MAGAKTLYVRGEDSATWEEATKAAAREGVSVSEFVTTAVRQRLDRQSGALAYEELSAESFDPLGLQTVRFSGRWIVNDMRSSAAGTSKQDVWRIAVTKFGRFVSHVRRANGVPTLTARDILDELASDLVPADVIDAARQALQEQGYAIWRDI